MRPRPRQLRALSRSSGASQPIPRHTPPDQPHQILRTMIDFRLLGLPTDVQSALADAFWNHVGSRPSLSIRFQWYHLRAFARFVAETRCVRALADLDRTLLLRYIEWLGQQRTAAGTPWSKSTQSVTYTAVRKLLQWLPRRRPGRTTTIISPFHPFNGRRRAAGCKARRRFAARLSRSFAQVYRRALRRRHPRLEGSIVIRVFESQACACRAGGCTPNRPVPVSNKRCAHAVLHRHSAAHRRQPGVNR